MKILTLIFFTALFFPYFYNVLPEIENTPSDLMIKSSSSLTPSSGIGAFVINLDRSPQRLAYIQQNIENLKIPLERIPAVDGNALSDAFIKENVELNTYQSYLGHLPKKGTIGCSLSHIKAWQAFLKSSFEFAIIFEDDISFEPKAFKQALNELIEPAHKPLWDLVNFEIHHRGMPMTIKTLPSSGHKLVIYLTEVTHAGAYLINRHAAFQLLQKALPIVMPIDHYFTRTWELNIKFRGLENPRLVHQTFGPSDIAKSHDLQTRNTSLLQKGRKILYKLHSYEIRFIVGLWEWALSFFQVPLK